VSVCFSKGLGAPVGSALVGSREFIARAHRIRKMAGGGMRQAGLLAAAASHALDHHVDRLADDHALAQRLAQGLEGIEGLKVEAPHTNIVFVDLTGAAQARSSELIASLNQQGILATGLYRLRFVTHLDVDAAGVDRAVAAIRAFFNVLTRRGRDARSSPSARFHRRRLAAEPDAGARRALHRDEFAALGRARRHRRRARHLAGCFVHIFAAAVGVGTLLATSAAAFTVLKYIGAAYLLYLGVRMVLSRAKPPADLGQASCGGDRRAQPQGDLPRRLLDERAQPQGGVVLPGLRAAVHRARMPTTRPCTSCCWACCSTSTPFPSTWDGPWPRAGWRAAAPCRRACTGSTARPASVHRLRPQARVHRRAAVRVGH
jgi:hypothetical protein